MNTDRTAGQWKQMKGHIKEQWGKLTDDDVIQLEGHSDQLAGRLQERYGIAREEAERQAREFRTLHDWH
ncbi:MAG: CsbD family protein [Steroidobacteraceae bacterium]